MPASREMPTTVDGRVPSHPIGVPVVHLIACAERTLSGHHFSNSEI
jgi:hypothetical protein